MSLPLPPQATLYAAWHRVNGHTDAAIRDYGQACRDAALEEAAQVCEALAVTDDHDSNITRHECADRIRSLKS